MPIKDPIKRKQYFRNYNRKRRAAARLGCSTADGKPARPSNAVIWRIETAKDLLDIIQVQLSELLESDVEVAMKSGKVAQLCGVAKQIIELTEISQDIEEVEAAIKEKKPAKKWEDAEY